MATKVLNLDAFVETKRSVTLDGVDHFVKEMSVEYFVKAQKAAEEMKKPDITAVDEFQKTVELIQSLIPTISVEVLSALSIPKLTQLGKFVQGMLDDEIKSAADKVAAVEAGNVMPVGMPATETNQKAEILISDSSLQG